MILPLGRSTPWIGPNRGEKDVKPLQRHSELMVEGRLKSHHPIGSIRPISRVVSLENLQSELNTADILLFVGPSCRSDAALR